MAATHHPERRDPTTPPADADSDAGDVGRHPSPLPTLADLSPILPAVLRPLALADLLTGMLAGALRIVRAAVAAPWRVILGPSGPGGECGEAQAISLGEWALRWATSGAGVIS